MGHAATVLVAGGGVGGATGGWPPSNAARVGGGGGSHPIDVAPSDGTGADGAPAFPHALFNGIDFAGWDRYLGEPTPGAQPLGIDNDPQGVYSVVTVEGEPAIRISGQVWGALISQQ